jgi:hypothetical protein
MPWTCGPKIGHVRVCGGSGEATPRFYPAGYIVLAVDGSRAEVPNSKENRETYGESENQYGKAVARANISVLYDVYNRFSVDPGQ